MKVKSESEVTSSCPTLNDSMDCILPGSPVHGIFQARVLEWGAIAFSVPGGSVVKNLPVNSRDTGDKGSIPGLGRSPGEGNGNPLLPGESHGQRSLVGYSPGGSKELDRAELLTQQQQGAEINHLPINIK